MDENSLQFCRSSNPLAKESEGLEFERKKQNSKASLMSSLLINTV